MHAYLDDLWRNPRRDQGMEKPVVNVKIDLAAIAKLGHIGVRRAALFLGLGLNGINQPGFKDYELHKLPPGQNLAALPPDIIPRDAPDAAVERFKHEFATWITGCGLRDMLEHYGLMLDHIHKYGLAVAQMRQFLDLLGNPEHLQFEFARRLGMPDKHDRLAKRFQIDPEYAFNLDSFYYARNALTHGLGIVRANDVRPDGFLVLRWLAFEMHAHGTDSDTKIPAAQVFGVSLPEARLFKVFTAQRELSYKIGDKIALTAQDLYEICLFMQMEMIPKTMKAFIDFLDEQGIEKSA